jgi:hypothetical protein
MQRLEINRLELQLLKNGGIELVAQIWGKYEDYNFLKRFYKIYLIVSCVQQIGGIH